MSTPEFINLKMALSETKRGISLINEQGNGFITTEPDQINGQAKYDHPFIERIKPEAFLKGGALISVLADDDVLSTFNKDGHWSDLPRFRIAGAPKAYKLDPTHLKVGVLTAGGNAPGLDAIVDALVKRQFLLGTESCNLRKIKLDKEGYPPDLKFYGIVGGYYGLQTMKGAKDSRWIRELKPRLTDTWAARGCSSLHALRTPSIPPEKNREYTDFINDLAVNVRELELDILYTIGGNGTMTVANKLGEILLHDGKKRCLVVAGPKTMDNDINFTDATFGYRTTVDNTIQFLRDFHREAETLERVGIVELFGEDSGFVALHSAYASGEADYVLIPEMMGSTMDDARKELLNAVTRIKERTQTNNHALLVVAEGATIRANAVIMADESQAKLRIINQLYETETLLKELSLKDTEDDKKKIENQFSDLNELVQKMTFEKISGSQESKGFFHNNKAEQDKAFMSLVKFFDQNPDHKAFFNQPRHLIRATPPNGFDMDLCKYTGKLMVDTALSGYTRCAIHLWQGNYVIIPLETAIAKLKRVDTTDYYFTTMIEKYTLRSIKLAHA